MAKKHNVATKYSPIHFTMNEDSTLLLKSSELLSHANVDSHGKINIISITNPQGTLVNNNNSTWSFTPSKYFSGSLTLDCILSDGVHKTIQPITIDVVHVMHSFEAPEVELYLQDNGSYLIYTKQLLQSASDIEGDNLDIIGMFAPQGSFINNADGSWTFIPYPEYLGAIDLSFVVSDGRNSVTQSLLVTVSNPATMPEIDYVMSENKAVTFSNEDLLQSASDIDGDTLTITDILPPMSGQLINNGNGTWTYLPPENYIGPLKLQFGVSDQRGAIVEQAINLYSVAENQELVPSQILYFEDNGTIKITAELLLSYDTDLVAKNVTINNVATMQGTIRQAGHGDNAYWIFTPNADFDDTIDLQYTVTDGKQITAHVINIEIPKE